MSIKAEDVRVGRVYKGDTGAIRYKRVVEIFREYGHDRLLWVAPDRFPGRDRLRRAAPLQGRVIALSGFARWALREVADAELEATKPPPEGQEGEADSLRS